MLKEFAKTFSTLEEWKVRAAQIRLNILKGTELDPLPPKTPLNPIYRNERRYDDYMVVNVAFESRPGIYVTGSLYRPAKSDGPTAAVLCPHGHWGSRDDFDRHLVVL